MTAIPLNLAGLFAGRLNQRPSARARDVANGLSSGTAKRGAFDATDNRRSADIIAPTRARSKTRPHEAMVTVVDRTNDSDELLLKAYQSGERDAFATLMQRYGNELLHFLQRFLGSRAAADDVFQETFLQVHLSADTFDTERRFKPWLFTIAANKARDYYRKQNRNAAASLSASIDSKGDGERFVDLLESPTEAPTMPLLDAERSSLVKKVIDAMPVHLREILLLSYFQRLSYNQIADSLEIPLGTVKSRLHSAVAAFARAWNTERGSTEYSEERSESDGNVT